jgi:hypothetical protein
MMRLLFPAAIEEITRRAGEERDAALQSGKASSSDIAAGLGARTRGGRRLRGPRGHRRHGQAAGPRAGAGVREAPRRRAARTAWKSLETPQRPPMLMNFGKVLLDDDPTDDSPRAARAAASTSSARGERARGGARHRRPPVGASSSRSRSRWNDGAGTYTPPGHWNDIATEYVRDARMSEVRAARVFAPRTWAMHDAGVGCWDTQVRLLQEPAPEPDDPRIRDLDRGCRTFPSYSSGTRRSRAPPPFVLSYLFPAGASSFEAMRDEAGISRLYGGIHYRADI